jgi:hypothetical protein
MLFILIYLVLLFIAPQLWIEPFVGVRVDIYLYPAWIGWIAVSGRAKELFNLGPQDRFFAFMLVWIVVTMAVNGFQPKSSDIIGSYVKWFVLYRLTVVSLPTFTHVRRAFLLVLFFALILAVEGTAMPARWHRLGGAGPPGDEAAAGRAAGRTRWINIFDGPEYFASSIPLPLPCSILATVRRRQAASALQPLCSQLSTRGRAAGSWRQSVSSGCT